MSNRPLAPSEQKLLRTLQQHGEVHSIHRVAAHRGRYAIVAKDTEFTQPREIARVAGGTLDVLRRRGYLTVAPWQDAVRLGRFIGQRWGDGAKGDQVKLTWEGSHTCPTCEAGPAPTDHCATASGRDHKVRPR